MKAALLCLVMISTLFAYPTPDGHSHKFWFQGDKFMLDEQEFKFVACEVHYPRIPVEYWEHRLRMSKALGCNVISAYIFWNYHEQQEGVFDFHSGNKNLSGFLTLAQNLGLWVLIRPGPYICAEWDAGGHPWWLLKEEDMRLRTRNPKYVWFVQRYIDQLTSILRPHQSILGGNILMLQIENEYGYLPLDSRWPNYLKGMWDQSGLKLPYYQAEPTTGILATHIPGVAIGINPGIEQSYFDIAKKVDSTVPIFSSETWLGWFTHYGDTFWGNQTVAESLRQVNFLISNNYSFSIYMVHGGTSFGFWAGANVFDRYASDITSYDYDCAINEAGQVTERYNSLREAISKFALWDVPAVPDPLPMIEIPEFTPQKQSNILSYLKGSIKSEKPLSFEQIDQPFGVVVYQTSFSQINKSDKLHLNVHDYAQVYLNDEFIGNVDRRLDQESIEFTQDYKQEKNILSIVVEAMGRINFGEYLFDRKGLIGSVMLEKNNGTKSDVLNWTQQQLPLSSVEDVKYIDKVSSPYKGTFFQYTLKLEQLGDTYLDMTKWSKGYLWVNDNNLGRFWSVGPQYRLFCPATFLKTGDNIITVLDLESDQPQPISGVKTLK